MAAAAGGDLAAVGGLFERHHRAVFDYFVRTTGDRARSEDLVQDTFVRVLKYADSYDARAPFRGWLFTIARNTRRDAYAAIRREDRIAAALPRDARQRSAESRVEAAFELDRVERALLDLPEPQRDLLILARIEGLTYAELSDVFECSAATLRVRVFRALQALRDRLQEEQTDHVH